MVLELHKASIKRQTNVLETHITIIIRAIMSFGY